MKTYQSALPFFRVDVAVKAPLISVLPRTPLEAKLLSFLISQVIAAHASMNKTPIIGLKWSRDGALVVGGRPLAALIGITVMEEQLLHLK